MMRCCSKEKICYSGFSKPNTGICNVCPSKLSKRELEDLYYTLAQKNLELKQTINQLTEKIKYQTTKLQRMLCTQQAYMGTEPKDCCATAKAIVQEQKQVIIELKNANENLQEQINNLNMKLCSTKQFMPRNTSAKNTPRSRSQTNKSPRRSPTRKQKISPRTPSVKYNAGSAFPEKRTVEKVQSSETKSVSSQYMESEVLNKAQNKMCDENKCKTQMEEMQQKILKLQEELAKTHHEYANRIAHLEREVIHLHSENMRVCSEKAVCEQNVKAHTNEAGDLKNKLAETESQCDKLSALLSIEKGKVAELRTQVKAANMTGGAVKAIEGRLNNDKTTITKNDSIFSDRTAVVYYPYADVHERKKIEGKNVQKIKTDGSEKQNDYPCSSKFLENIREKFTKYIEADENYFKIDVECSCPDSDNALGNEVASAKGSKEPMSRNNIIDELSENDRNTFPDNKNCLQGDADEFYKNQTTSDKLYNRPLSINPDDNVQRGGNIDQNIIKYRENTAFRLRNKDRPTDDSSNYKDTITSNENQLKEQEMRDRNTNNLRDVIKLNDDSEIKDGGDSRNNTNGYQRGLSPRGVVDKNIESGADKCLKPDDDKVDYTTEYRSQYSNRYRNSLNFQNMSPRNTAKTAPRKSLMESNTLYGTDVIPEFNGKQRETSLPMSELVNKANEASLNDCNCREKCECINYRKTAPPATVETATTTPFEPSKELMEQQAQKLEPLSEQVQTTEFPSQTPDKPMQKEAPLPMSVVNKANESRLNDCKCACREKCMCNIYNKTAPPTTVETATNTSSDPGKESQPQQGTKLEALSEQVQTTESSSQPPDKHMALHRETVDKSADTSTAKTADDSGFTEPDYVSRVTTPEGRLQAMLRDNRELEKRVSEMQAQLDQLKTHVLSRKDTYTVFKDEATTSDAEQKTERGIQNSIIPFDDSAQTDTNVRVDPRHVCIKVPRKGYALIEQQQGNENDKDGKIGRNILTSPKYNPPGLRNSVPSCESTCVRDRFTCTKECLNSKKKVLNVPDSKKLHKKNDENIKYHVPKPLPAYSTDMPATKCMNDERILQPTPMAKSGAGQLEKNMHCINSAQNSNFCGGNNPNIPQNMGYVKQESPPMNRTQCIDIRVPPKPPNNQDAQYAKETAFNSHYVKNGGEPQLKNLNTETAHYTNDPSITKSETPKILQQQEHGEVCCCSECLKLKNASTKRASKLTKNIPVKCMCHQATEYTTNMLHTTTGPIIEPNYEKSIHSGNVIQSSADNATSIHAPRNDFQKDNITQEENTRNDNILRSVPGYNASLETTASIEKNQLFKLKDTDRFKGTESRRESRFIEKDNNFQPRNKDELQQRFLTRYTDNYGRERPLNVDVDRIQKEDKVQQKNRLESCDIDIKGSKRYFGENTEGSKMNDVLQKPEERDRSSLLSGKNKDVNSCTGKTRQEDLLNYNQQPQSMPVATSSPLNYASKRPSQNLQTDKTIGNQLEICESHTQVCTCPKTNRREVAVFRSCSGTLRFETIRTPSHIRKCNCPNPDSLETSGTKQCTTDSIKNTDQNTYTIEASANLVGDKVPKVVKYSRPTSPENTDQEISSLTDLPSEKETSTSPRQSPGCRKCTRSPGEDKSATTKSETVTSPSSSSQKPTSFPLSEGEMPQYFAKSSRQRADSFNIASQQPLEEKRKEGEPSTLKVEQALACISEELSRCRQLLETPKETQSQKDKENTVRLKDLVEYEKSDSGRDRFERRKDSREAMTGPIIPDRSSFALHYSQAKPHISNVPYTPHVIFTLHIGTIVLSDEAVINSRNLSLVLIWKFYDQNITMSHMRQGRVVHFDFSTEYDVKLTEHFLQYLKNEELQIKVCEINKLNSPLASCSLPLHEALLHTNRRADMSLALIAGPQMKRSAPDSLDTRDEMGVLDLWCMLRAEPRIWQKISKAIAHSRPSKIDGSKQSIDDSSLSPLLMQLDDDQDGIHLSADLDHVFSHPIRLPVRDSENTIDRGAQLDVSNQIRQERRRSTNFGYIDPTTLKRNLSGIITNKEPASTRPEEQMRQVIRERSKSTNQLSWGPSLQDKYPNLRNQRKNSSTSNQGVNTSSLMEPPVYSVSRDWKKADDNDSGINKLSGSEPTRGRRNSFDSGVSTMMDLPAKRAGRYEGSRRSMEAYEYLKNKRERNKISDRNEGAVNYTLNKEQDNNKKQKGGTIDIVILWLALNEECPAMSERSVQRLYVAYSFLGRSGADLETPQSLPKPKQYQEKCYYNFKKSFQLTDAELVKVARLAQCRSPLVGPPNPRDSVVFTVVSEPDEDLLGLNNCEDIGYAYLYFGDLIAYSADSDTYTEVIPIRDSKTGECICGVLAVRVDGLNVIRQCLKLNK